MGRAIEEIAKQRGHKIGLIVGRHESEKLEAHHFEGIDVSIDFSTPGSAKSLILKSLSSGTPTVSGTTGWLKDLELVHAECSTQNTAFFYASNFSIGMNILFDINKRLARLMNGQIDYEVYMDEIHHQHKIDTPSGTAITLAEDIIERLDRKESWKLEKAETTNELVIRSSRVGEVPGTHLVNYQSDIDKIQISHEAFGREGFALGAVMAAEWVANKQGIFGMENLLAQT